MTNPAPERKHVPTRLIALAIVLLVVLVCVDSSIRPFEPEPNFALREPVTPDNVQQVLGRGLRVAIDAVIRGERGAKAIGRHDLSALVQRFIPIGTSLIDAERILAAAGFDVYEVRDHYPRVMASIRPYLSGMFPTDCFISLYPAGSFAYVADLQAIDWTTVRGLSAGFSPVSVVP